MIKSFVLKSNLQTELKEQLKDISIFNCEDVGAVAHITTENNAIRLEVTNNTIKLYHISKALYINYSNSVANSSAVYIIVTNECAIIFSPNMFAYGFGKGYGATVEKASIFSYGTLPLNHTFCGGRGCFEKLSSSVSKKFVSSAVASVHNLDFTTTDPTTKKPIAPYELKFLYVCNSIGYSAGTVFAITSDDGETIKNFIKVNADFALALD